MFGRCREQRAHITGDGLHCMTVSAVRRHIWRQTNSKSYWKWITVAPCSSSRWANRGTCNEQNTPSVHSVGKRGEATNEHTVSRYHNRNRAHETEWKASSFWTRIEWKLFHEWKWSFTRWQMHRTGFLWSNRFIQPSPGVLVSLSRINIAPSPNMCVCACLPL